MWFFMGAHVCESVTLPKSVFQNLIPFIFIPSREEFPFLHYKMKGFFFQEVTLCLEVSDD